MGTGLDLPLDQVLVGDCIATLKRLPLEYPAVSSEQRAEMDTYRRRLEAEQAKD